MDAFRYLDTRAVAERLGIAVRTVHSYKANGRLPPPDRVVGRSPLWLPETIEHYIAGLAPHACVYTGRRVSHVQR